MIQICIAAICLKVDKRKNYLSIRSFWIANTRIIYIYHLFPVHIIFLKSLLFSIQQFPNKWHEELKVMLSAIKCKHNAHPSIHSELSMTIFLLSIEKFIFLAISYQMSISLSCWQQYFFSIYSNPVMY